MSTAVMDTVIGAQLNERREAAGLSLDSLGARLQLPGSRIDDFEAARAPVLPSVLARLSEVLGVRLVSFVLNTDPERPTPLPATERDHVHRVSQIAEPR